MRNERLVLLHREGRPVSTSMVGRILAELKRRGVLLWKHFTARDVISRWDVVQAHTLRLFVLPPPSPKLNGAVERAQRTHTEEFYQVTTHALEMAVPNRELGE